MNPATVVCYWCGLSFNSDATPLCHRCRMDPPRVGACGCTPYSVGGWCVRACWSHDGIRPCPCRCHTEAADYLFGDGGVE